VTRIPTATEPLYSALGGDPDLRDIVDQFVWEMPERVANLLDRLNSGNWEELRRLVHQLKGAAGSYGFDLLTPSAGRVEDAIREARTEEEIRRAVDSLVALCAQARAGTPG
jgi:HPt (histidine-containing phosphotransfer) domain-containing protein